MLLLVQSTIGGSLLAGQNTTLESVQLLVILLLITLGVALISRRLRLPYTLVLVIVGLVIGFSPLLPNLRLSPDVIMFLFLPALLFEGAWNVEVKLLVANWLPVLLLAVPGLLLSLLIVAAILHWSLGFSWLLAMLVGAMISPTDPVAVLALLRQMGLSDRLRTIVEGESLFNDGVGAVAFELVLGFLLAASSATGAVHESPPGLVILDVLWLMLGGIAIGLGVGLIVARFLRRVEDHLIEITITLITAYGVYLLGTLLQTSGLLAVVSAGLVVGSYGRQAGLSERAVDAADDVWEFIGYIANSLIFLLLGVQIGESHLTEALPGISWALVGVVVGRAAMIYIFLPLHDALARRLDGKHSPKPAIFPHAIPLPSRWRPIILLSGLRGALSIALVLSLPTTLPQLDLLEDIVYGVVLITLLGQGIGLSVLLPVWSRGESDPN
jgi:CPA1 family monovalent cation:H+ antiporter